MTNRTKRVRSWALLLGALAACDPKDEAQVAATPVNEGALRAVTFSYSCAGPGDAQCDADAELAPVAAGSSFPAVAVGTQFVVGVKLSDTPGPVTIGGAGGAFLTTKLTELGTLVTASRPGNVALLALSGQQVVDLTTLELREIDHIALFQASPRGDFKGGALSLNDGKVTASADVRYTFKFRVAPVDKDGKILAGALPVQWTTEDPSVARLTSAPNENIATFVSGAAGSTKVRATVGDRSVIVNIAVGG
jgi:hypothetical protein